ncbi:hypothetical protein [Aminobacter sp. BE322]|uniref:hypothetical protein n=1 Tax=unclassified Aminobacter TaxID=2644704 RepID=UPI003D1FC77C
MTHLKKILPPEQRNDLKASMAVAKGAADKVISDHLEPDPSLAPWQITSTAAHAVKVFENGAAILPKSVIADEKVPRVKGGRKILLAIGRAIRTPDKTTHKGYYAADLLRDIDFQHHQSTNGLWNPELGRWERWGARDADGWLQPQVNDPKMKSKASRRVNERTFRRIKEDLIALGLIEQTRKDFPRGRRIWLKPTTEFSRILFEPGYWDQVRDKYAPAKVTKPKSGKKPRGLSARHKQIDDENLALYRQVIHHELTGLTPEMKKLIWEKLTKPIPLTKNHVKQPFAEFGSYRYKRLMEAI